MKYSEREKRNHAVKTLGEAIHQMFSTYKLDGKMEELQLIENWKKITGKAVANRTEKIFLNREVLHVQISSAPLRNTLALSRDKLKKQLNESLGKNLVKEILIY